VIGEAFGAPHLLANTESDLVPRSGARACKNRKFIELKLLVFFNVFLVTRRSVQGLRATGAFRRVGFKSENRVMGKRAFPVCVPRRRGQFRLDKIWFEPEDGR